MKTFVEENNLVTEFIGEYRGMAWALMGGYYDEGGLMDLIKDKYVPYYGFLMEEN